MAHPALLPVELFPLWDKPWTHDARSSSAFRSWLHHHGYLSPHFTLKEAACRDGTPIPRSLEAKARNHAFRMEQLRHLVGDKSIPVISWYRTRAYNKRVHGAVKSQHINAVACDISKETVERIGRAKIQRAAEVIWADGGVGTYPAGSMHFDSRGQKARWSSFVGQ